MNDNPLDTKVSIDTSDYKAGIAELNRQINILTSGFKAQAASMGDWSKTASGLETRNKTLADVIDRQRQKVDGLQRVYDDLAASGKASGKELELLQIRINKETEALNKSEAELKANETALDQTGKEVKDLGEETEKTTKKSNSFSSALSGLGKALGAVTKVALGVTLAVAGIAGSLGLLVTKSAEAADELAETAVKTGLTTTQLQEFAYIGEQTGTGVDTVTGAMAKMIRTMDSAREGTGEAADAYKALGISVVDSNGQLRSNQEVFAEALAALAKIPGETERDAAAMAIFGKSAQELNPLIKTNSADLAQMVQDAHDIGAVVGEEDVQALAGFNDQMASMKMGLQGTLSTLAAAFLPGFKNLADAGGGYLKQFSDIVRGSNGDLTEMVSGVGNLIGEMVSALAAKAPELMEAGLGLLQGVINAVITNLPKIATAAVSIIQSLVKFLATNAVKLIPAAIQVMMTLIQGILTLLPDILLAAIQIIVALATGIAQALPTLIPAVVAIIPQIILILLQNLPLLIDAALQIILGLASGLVAALPVLIPEIPKIVQAIFDALITALPMIGDAAVQLILTLVTGIIGALPSLGEAAVQIIDAVVNGLKGLYIQINQVGMDIVEGVWQGIQDSAATFAANISAFFTNMVDTAKEALGIHSPSTVFTSMGNNAGDSFGGGIVDRIRRVRGLIASALRGMTSNLGGLNLSLSGAGISGAISSVTNSQTQNFYAPVVYQYGSGRDAQAQKTRRW